MGARALRSIQMGRETVAGTAVAATFIWRGLGTIEDQRGLEFVDEDVGYLGGLGRTSQPRTQGAITFDPVPATFEQLPHLLEAHVDDVGTGVADGGGTGKLYTYTWSPTAIVGIKSYTIEGATAQQEEEIDYGFVKTFRLTGRGMETWKMSADWLGQAVALDTKTAALVPPTVEDILFGGSTFAIDAVGGTLGATAKTGTLLSCDFTSELGDPIYTADAVGFTTPPIADHKISARLRFLQNANAETERAAWRAGTPRQMRITSTGSTLGTGATFTKKTLRLDMCGTWDNFGKVGEQGGSDIVEGLFHVHYNLTALLKCVLLIVNEVASL